MLSINLLIKGKSLHFREQLFPMNLTHFFTVQKRIQKNHIGMKHNTFKFEHKNCRTLSYPATNNRYVLESESDISRDILRTENPLAINIIKTFLCVGVGFALFITVLNLGLEAIDLKYLLVSHKSALKFSHLHQQLLLGST